MQMMMEARLTSEAAVQTMMAADAVLPEQFFRPERGTIYTSGERGLMWAVFADGIESYRRNVAAKSPERKLEFMEAEHWVLSNDCDGPFSFVNLCQMFGFSAPGIRAALTTWKCQQRRPALRRQRFRPVLMSA